MMFTSLVATCLAGIVAYTLFEYFKYLQKCARVKVPGYRQFIFFGNLAIRMFPNLLAPLYTYSTEIFQHNNGMYTKLKSDVITWVSANRIVYWVKGAENIREITVSHRKNWEKPIHLYRVLDYFGTNILTTRGDTWKRHRLVANPAFSDANNKLVAESTVDNVHKLFDRWMTNEITCMDGSTGYDVPKVNDDMALLTFAVIAKAGFGQVLNPFIDSSEANTFGNAFRTVLHYSFIRMGLPDFLFKLPFGKFRRIADSFDEFEAFLKKVIKEKRAAMAKTGAVDADLMSMLLNAVPDADLEESSGNAAKTSGAKKVALSDEEVFADTFMFFLAGHETTASTLSWALCFLASHPDVQRKLQEEADAVLGERDPTIDDVPQLVYSACVFKETLRFFPPVPIIPKQAVTDVKVGGVTIPKGAEIGLDCYSMHRDERYFPDPLVFKPERHDTRVSPELTRYSFIPFSMGQRSCIGRRFAQVEAVLTLSMIAQKFRVSYAPDVNPFTQMDMKYMISIQPKKPVHVVFRPRG